MEAFNRSAATVVQQSVRRSRGFSGRGSIVPGPTKTSALFTFNCLHATQPTTRHDYCTFMGVSNSHIINDGAVLDKGSHLCLIPKSKLPEDAYTPTNGGQIKGIKSSVNIIGHFMAKKVKLGDLGECELNDIKFDVIDTEGIPIIIGQGVLGATNASQVKYDYDAKILSLDQRNGAKNRINLVDQLPPPSKCSANVLHASDIDVPSPALPSPSSKETEPRTKPTGKELVDWARNDLGVKINTRNMNEAIRLASLLWDHQEVFGNEENYGHYKKPITIPTLGQPMPQKVVQ